MANEHAQIEYQPQPYKGDVVILPIPENFPVNWPTPSDQYLLWELDTHYVKPRKKLDDILINMLCDHFLLACNDDYSYPFKIKSWVVNSSLYGAYSYDLGAVPEEGIKKYMAKLGPAMLNLPELWEHEWLPELKRHLAYWDAFDLKGASMEALLTHWDETIQRQHICLNIRLKIFIPVMLGRDILNQTYAEIFTDARPFDGCAMLLEYGRNTKYERDIWALSREVLASPALSKILLENDAKTSYAKLNDCEQGRLLRDKIDKYLLIYGKRGERGTLVTHSLNPVLFIDAIKHDLKQPDDYLDKRIKTWEARRDLRLQAVREQLQSYPQEVVERFETHLKMCENAHKLREEHNAWLDVPVLHHFRVIIQEFARRLTEAGVIDTPEDIGYVSAEELREAAAKLPEILDLRQRISERQLEEEKFANVAPPAFMGAYPTSEHYTLDPVTLSYINVEAPSPVEVAGGLGAVPASSGKVIGRAKIVRNLYDIDKLEAGDIMVVESLAPSWTPLFDKIGGVLADIGGVLSHAAILAREYGIPCVVGFRVATWLIKDGQLIEVDGDKGTVLFLDEA